jgi:hypothetical protein
LDVFPLNLYTQAISEQKRKAQARLLRWFCREDLLIVPLCPLKPLQVVEASGEVNRNRLTQLRQVGRIIRSEFERAGDAFQRRNCARVCIWKLLRIAEMTTQMTDLPSEVYGRAEDPHQITSARRVTIATGVECAPLETANREQSKRTGTARRTRSQHFVSVCASRGSALSGYSLWSRPVPPGLS